MGRDNYDDMESPKRVKGTRSSSTSKVGLIAALGIVICLIAIALYIFLAPPAEEKGPEGQTPVAVEVKQVEPVPENVTVISVEPVVTPAATEQSAASETQGESTAPVQSEVVSVAPSANSNTSTNTTTRPVTAVSITQASQNAVQSSSSSIVYVDHVVAEGEDLNSIAEFYGLKPQTLISVNNIRNVSAVVPGAVLRIPDRDGSLYTVQEGDMLSSIASRFNPELGWRNLMSVNGLKSETIRVGQVLFIPDPPDEDAVTLESSALTFVAPVDGGTISTSFNQRVNGSNLQGVYITGPAGSAVRATARGVVIDAGNSKDLGRFVVIQHDEGYKTTYGYLETVTVKLSAEVEQGVVIGSIGTSGDFTRPTLFFKIEQSGIALNPEAFF